MTKKRQITADDLYAALEEGDGPEVIVIRGYGPLPSRNRDAIRKRQERDRRFHQERERQAFQ